MATYTSHYNLKKPATSDKIRIADFNGNADTIDSTMYDNESLIAKLKADIGIVENTNTATHNISAGQYVIWKGDLYTASSAISSGATLSSANLTAVSGGGLNALNSNKANKIQSLVTDGTTDNDGDIPIQLSPSEYVVVACYPDRTAPAGYYTNWYSVLPFGSVTGNAKYSAKCVKDNLDPLIQTNVRFIVYYIQL